MLRLSRATGWVSRNKALTVWICALPLGLVGLWGAYAAYGHSLVAAAYKESHPLLIRLIGGQVPRGVDGYCDRADQIFLLFLHAMALVVLFLECLPFYLRGVRVRLLEPSKRPRWEEGHLFLVSFLILFMELAAIRWFSAHVVFLTFFSNFVLIAVFVGMSVGCLAARRRANLIFIVSPLIFVAVGSAAIVWLLSTKVGVFAVQVGDLDDPARVFFGTILPVKESGRALVPVEAVISAFFVLIALIFIGIGQELGRSLSRIEGRIRAYTINILGSLAGIVAFAISSYLCLSPFWWFLISFVCLLWFFRARLGWIVCNGIILAASLLVVNWLDWSVHGPDVDSLWSPYYHLQHERKSGWVKANGIQHQVMVDRAQGGIAYSLPYLLRRNSGARPIEDVLIIGSGSGNDAAHALWHGVSHIDAVEIDPMISLLGAYHPNQPYSDPRVTVTTDDGRSFLRRTSRKYDLIVYALVDSLTLHSCYSSVRLESFLFTREAFAAVRSRLKEGGLFVAYNFYRQGWVISRLRDMLADVFEQEPIAIALPSRKLIVDTEQYRGMTVLLAGATGGIRRRFDEAGDYALDLSRFEHNLSVDGFQRDWRSDAQEITKVFPAELASGPRHGLPSDDWPFFYLKHGHIPAHNIRGLLVVLLLSVILLVGFAPVRSVRLNPHFLFLGAGFMLIETNSVIRLSLVFGSTWLVNAIVFFAILTMILLANLYVSMRRPTKMAYYYVGLMASLLLNVLVDLRPFLAVTGSVRLVACCLFMFLPMFFAGIIFASSFRRSSAPDVDFGANIAGVVVGGILEYAALVTGYRLVLVMVMGLYLLSLIGLRRLHASAG